MYLKKYSLKFAQAALSALSVCWLFGLAAVGFGQGTGTIKGTVSLEAQNLEIHDVIVVIVQLKRSTTTDEKGAYEFKDVPPGAYNLVAKFDRLPDVIERVEVKAGETTTADLKLKLTGLRDQVTVSATGNEQSALESFQSVNSLDATALLERDTSSLGEALDKQTGIAKRSSGPGASRPVIRGFDGDRVLVAQDGIRSGSLSSTSGDHGEPINVLSVEKIEVVRGPATLLYGSSAIGGLVNAVSGHEQAHEGLHGYLSGVGASTQNLGGISAGLEFGKGKWLVWGNGGGQKSGDYSSPRGKVLNTGLHNYDFTGGSGYFTEKGFLNASYSYNRNFYGVPYDTTEPNPEISKLDMHSQDVRLNAGFNNLTSSLEHVHLTFNYTDYKHQELVGGVPATQFFNKTYSYRSFFEQKAAGKLTGSFGVSGFYRDFKTVGDEALAPPTTQNSFAAFAVETVDFKRVALQFGGRMEHNVYNPISSAGLPDRSFTGFSGALGIRVPLWEHGVFAANYVHSYRAPSLDELYNNGPHPGNLTFEIGNPNLKRERGDGIDLSLRHSSERVRAEGHYFNYKFGDFVFLAPTGVRQDNLPVAKYSQADSRYKGVEADVSIGLKKNIWLNSGLDYVSAGLTANGTPLPRIPPLRGRLGMDFQFGAFRLNPEVVMSRDQNRLFTNEERTAGYGIVNVLASYTIAEKHAAHIFSVNGFNLGNKLYFNHLSFLKDIAPEIGRGVRVSYTVRFF